MIVDRISNWQIYFAAPIFEKIFKELNNFNINTPNGTYKTNDEFYFKVMSYETNNAPSVIESHCKEVDIQVSLSGKEKIKLYTSDAVKITDFYSEEIDCQFYKAIAEPQSEIILQPGYMAIFFPDDIHHPQFAVGKTETLKKIVIKTDEKLFS